MHRLRTGDEVIAIAGKNKGSKGVIKKFITKKSKTKKGATICRALVEGLNLVKKCVRANPEKGEQGGIISKEAPIDISNLAIVNPKTGRADKVGFKLLEDGTKVRFFKSNDEVIASK